jgi:hypothetical protein
VLECGASEEMRIREAINGIQAANIAVADEAMMIRPTYSRLVSFF